MLLDSASLYFRAFYGVPDTVSAPDGTPVNAVRGFLDIIAKLVSTYRPTDLVACWDDDWRPQWRVDLIPSYKAHRVLTEVEAGPDAEQVPDRLLPQIPVIREALGVLGIPIVGTVQAEADDIIGTLATRATQPVDIVTGDRDLFQLVDDARDVRVVYTARGMSNLEIVTDDVLLAKYGVHAAQYADFATMRGDSSDGLPGVAGVGDKTAATLLQKHGDLAGILAAAEAGEGMTAGVRAKLDAAREYLAVAPDVVRVAIGLDLPQPDSALRMPDAGTVDALGAAWGLGASLQRAQDAITAAAAG